MTRVRTTVHPGWVEVTGEGVTAVVEVAERHLEALENAAAQGPVHLLDLLCSRGLLVMPSFALAMPHGDGTRVLLRGTCTVLADGEQTSAEGREPWREVVLEGAEVTLAAPDPEPRVARGWRRPSRLRAAAAEPAQEPVVGSDAGTDGPEREQVEVPVDAVGGRPEPEPVAEAEQEAAVDPEPVVEPEQEPDDAAAAEPTDGGDGVDAADEDAAAGADGPGDEPEPAPAPPVAPADLTLPPPEDAPGQSPADRVPPSPPPESGLIDSVPWRRPGGAPAGPTAPPPVPAAAPAPTAVAVPAPAEHTVLPDPEPEPAPPPEPAAADHHPAPAAGSEEAAPEVTTARASLPRSDADLDRPVVLAVLCPAGHHSPPHAGRCRQCGREIPPQQPAPIPRPTLGVLRISTGGSVPLDRGVLLGRAPRVNEELPPNQRPHLIRVGGVDRDISRNHAEVVLEGWHVLVRDLGSTNGTTVALPGEEPVRLRPTEDQGIEPGTVITLADEVSLTYEVEG